MIDEKMKISYLGSYRMNKDIEFLIMPEQYILYSC